ncbi:aspartate aminotransferase family protein [candidate division KSB1 bacterium]
MRSIFKRTEQMDFRRSKSFFERAKRSLAGGVSSGFRAHQKPQPLFFEKGEGARLVDVDGNEFIDYTLAYGPLILGHSHPAIVAAVTEQIGKGSTYGAQHELEFLLAEELIRLIPAAERVLFGMTGTEAVQTALRLARAYTGRTVTAKFEGHYHGWMDDVLVSYRPSPEGWGDPERPERTLTTGGQRKSAAAETVVLPWNDLEATEAILRSEGERIAAVILEPFLSNTGSISPAAGFLPGLKKTCEDLGIVLIFDEIITGFRVALGGAQELFGIKPDLAVYGKAVAGGYPLSLMAGKADIIDQAADGTVMHVGTFNGNPVALAASLATLKILSADGDAAYERINHLGRMLRTGFREAAEKRGQNLLVQGLDSTFHTFFTDAPAIVNYRDFRNNSGRDFVDFAALLLERGVLAMIDGRWYLSLAHTETDIELTIEAFYKALEVF